MLRSLEQGCRSALKTSDWDQLQTLATAAEADHQAALKEQKTAADVAKAAREWLQGTLEEASGIAATLEQSAQTLRESLEPKESSEALREAYREAKRNFIDVAELRGALEAMGKGKTGRTCHRRSFRRRLRGCPWPVPRLFDPTLPTLC